MRIFPWVTVVLINSLLTPLLYGQQWKNHQWKDRVILLVAASEDSPEMRKQIEAFSQADEGMKERKLVAYRITPQAVYKGLTGARSVEVGQLSDDYFSRPFSVILIGLDGGVKLTRHEAVQAEVIFDLIDSMPMRRSELRSSDHEP